MKTIKWILTARLPVVALLVCLLPTASSANDLKPGETISRLNVERITDLVSPGIYWTVENGMDMKIVPYQKISPPQFFLDATEKYAAQVSLEDGKYIRNWVAGFAFPDIDPNDPEAAVKVMYNQERGNYYITDDMHVHSADADTGGLTIDSKGDRHYSVERHFIADWIRMLKYEGRLVHEPMPAITDNHDEVLTKRGMYPLIEPFDLRGVGTVLFRYKDTARMDDTWLYIPMIRRVRRMSSAQRSDALFGQDIDQDSYGGFRGNVGEFDWKLLGVKPALASFHGENLPPKVCERDGGLTYCENWEVRPEVYIIEGKPLIPSYAYSKRIIYVDKEIFMVPYADMYDRGEQLWKSVLLSTRYSKKPNPNTDYEYDRERLFVYAFTVIDMQLMHGTRAAIPGMQFPDETGWYLDIGPDAPQSVTEDWWTIAGLLTGTR